jgi:histidine ammonia-lyase
MPGRARWARRIVAGCKGSRLLDSRPGEVQDSYSLRCYPQVAGPILSTLQWAEETLQNECNAVTDNPLIFTEDAKTFRSGGNFHGEPVALACDYLKIAMCELAGISERRTFKLLSRHINNGLPSMLSTDPGLQSGLMIFQYTAAALVSENKVLAHPASVDSIPTSEDIEDHVSMGTIAARQFQQIVTQTCATCWPSSTSAPARRWTCACAPSAPALSRRKCWARARYACTTACVRPV